MKCQHCGKPNPIGKCTICQLPLCDYGCFMPHLCGIKLSNDT